MAIPNKILINAIRTTANNLKEGAPYQWGHMGSCNCGNLAQELTNLSKAEIHEYAMRKYGDWTEQVNDYCPNSGLPMDLLISEMLKYGLEIRDLKNLERLSDPEVLSRLPDNSKNLSHNSRPDVILYLDTWATILEKKLTKDTQVGSFRVYKEVETV